MIPVKITGLGSYLPARVVTSTELETTLDIPRGWIAQVTGIHERRYVTGETAVDMAVGAAERALADAGLTPADLDAIVGASSAPQQTIPCTAALIQRQIGAPDGDSVCFDMNATCLSFMVALHMVGQMVAAGVYRNALVCSSEMARFSRNPAERESAVLFGDAAAAAVITCAAPGEPSALWHAQFATYSSGADLTTVRGGGTLHHPNDPATTPEMNMFHMDGPMVFRRATRLIAPFLDTFFAELGWQYSEVDLVVPHQSSRHGIAQLWTRLGFSEAQVFSNLAERGNCIAASVPLALAEAVDQGRIARGDRVVLIGTGAGLTLGALALTY